MTGGIGEVLIATAIVAQNPSSEDVALLVLAVWVFASFLLALIPASIASKKGRSGAGFWLFGSAAFIPALIVALVISPTPHGQDRLNRQAGRQPCQYCREYIRVDATLCPYCHRESPIPLVPGTILDAGGAVALPITQLENGSAAQLVALVDIDAAARAAGYGTAIDAAWSEAWPLAEQWGVTDHYRSTYRHVANKRMDIPIRLRPMVAHIAGQTMVALAVSQYLNAQDVALLLGPYQTVFGPVWSDGSTRVLPEGVVPPAQQPAALPPATHVGSGLAACSHCGEPARTGARYCGACGTPLPSW